MGEPMTEFVVFPELEKCGRLGNTLHQIASTVGLARKHGLRPLFPAEYSYRPYFSIPDEFFAPRNVLVQTSHVHAASLVPHLDPRTAIYLQDLSLWADVADEVRAMFEPSDRAKEELIRGGDVRGSLALHIRRGDNLVQQEFYPVAPLEFWLAAVDQYPPRQPIRLYSDDMEWCITVLAPALEAMGRHPVLGAGHLVSKPRLKEHEQGYWSETATDWIDLLLLARNEHYVIANSSFGWWGAWLSRSKDVHYQWPFYGPRLSVEHGGYADATLMMPPEWKRLPL